MEVVDLVLPVFAVIVTGWLAGQLGYISRSLADGLVHFAYNVAMPALLFVTVAQEPARHLLEWRFLLAFGGGSILCFVLVLMVVRIGWGRDLRSGTMFGMSAAMTNTGFVALPILHAIYGQPAVLPAAIATLFVAAVMFPAQRRPAGNRAGPARSARQRRRVGEADRAQSDGAVDHARSDVDDRRPAASGAIGGLFEHLRRRAHPLRAVCDRARTVDGGTALQPRGIRRAGCREIGDHAVGRVRAVRGRWV